MGERKVLNRYYPPDFDHKLIPRREKGWREKRKSEVRMMLPFSIQCDSCGQYMYRGKKFNSRKEDVEGDTYLGIKKFRFYMKCSTCSAQFVIKTDPKNLDYEVEKGCKRLFEAWKEKSRMQEEETAAKAAAEMGDSMKALENRTAESKREMDIMDGLDEIKAQNNRKRSVDTAGVLKAIAEREKAKKEQARQLQEEDEALIAQFKRDRSEVKRLENDDEDADDEAAAAAAAGGGSGGGGKKKRLAAAAAKKKSSSSAATGKFSFGMSGSASASISSSSSSSASTVRSGRKRAAGSAIVVKGRKKAAKKARTTSSSTTTAAAVVAKKTPASVASAASSSSSTSSGGLAGIAAYGSSSSSDSD